MNRKTLFGTLGALVLVTAVGLMGASNFRIDELPDAGTAVGTDKIEIYRSQTGTKSFSMPLTSVDTYMESAMADVDLGASGTAGSLDIFPSTAAKGKIIISAVDNSGDTALTITNEAQAGAGSFVIPDMGGRSAGAMISEGCSFTESASTTYTCTIELPAASILHDICFTNTVLWGATTAVVDIGDDDDSDGWFDNANIKATDIVVGEVVCASDDGAWGGVDGAYLTTAGRRGRVTSGVDSGLYIGAATEVIIVVTAGTPSTTGRSYGWVNFTEPQWVASTDA